MPSALETRVNEAVMRRLSNARTQVVGAPSDFPVIFDREGMLAEGGISGVVSVAKALDTDVAAQGITPNTTHLVVESTNYTVRDSRPLGAGMTLLQLGVR